MHSRKGAWLVLFSLLTATRANAYNYPEINWKTTETPHFVIHYYDEVEGTARKVISIAEDVYLKVTGIYGHEPERKTHLVIRDDEDTSNGFAIYSLGFVTLWATPSSLSLRGRHDWIREVLTHEFAHVVSLQASNPTGWRIEGFRLGGIANTDTQGNTDVGGSLFLPTHPFGRWWAEGTAQLDTLISGHDAWDTNRDMLLRAATLEGKLLTFDQMRNIGVREHFGGEMVYNQGFAFLIWLRDTFGPDANKKIAADGAASWSLDFDRHLENAFGVPARELHSRWTRHLEEKYARQVADIRTKPTEGVRIPLKPAKILSQGDPDERPYKDGVFNSWPRFSPNGLWFSWVDGNVVKLRKLDEPFVLSPPDDPDVKPTEVVRPVPLELAFPGRFYAWSPDSRALLVSKREPNHLNGYPYFDLFRVDLSRITDLRETYVSDFRNTQDKRAKKKLSESYSWRRQGIVIRPKKLTRGLRATHIAWSPDGKTIAFSKNGDGHRDLVLSRPDGSEPVTLVAIGGDAEATDSVWSPDGTTIAFTLYHHDQADIWLAAADGSRRVPITLDKADDREPSFSNDGKYIFFSSDRSGIFQIYRKAVDAPLGSPPEEITRVETGAFMPHSAANDSKLVYSRFSATGYKPYELSLTPPSAAAEPTANSTVSPAMDQAKSQLEPEVFQEQLEGKKYFFRLRPARLFPTTIWENDQFKAGLAMEISDYLEKHQFIGSALFGFDQDYQVIYSNQMFVPTFTTSYTSYIRNNAFPFFNDQDNIADDPETNVRDNIQFITAGLSQDFRSSEILSGQHTLSIEYDRRFVDRRIGYPIFGQDNNLETGFRLITNDGVSLRWTYRGAPDQGGRDSEINPRNQTLASVGYSFVRTALFSEDPLIPSPSKHYTFHEGTISLAKFFAMPWTSPSASYHTYWIRFTGGVKSRDVSYQDEFFLGGRLNFRAFGQISSNTLFYGYEDFSISGETLVLLSTGYTFPLLRAIDRKTGVIYWDSVYATLFGEIGNAWPYGQIRNQGDKFPREVTDPATDLDPQVFFEDVGGEIRVRTFLFNDTNPWNSIFRVAYGIQDRAKYGFSDEDIPIRFFVGVGTNF